MLLTCLFLEEHVQQIPSTIEWYVLTDRKGDCFKAISQGWLQRRILLLSCSPESSFQHVNMNKTLTRELMKITLIYSPYLIYTHTFYCKKTSIENYCPFTFFFYLSNCTETLLKAVPGKTPGFLCPILLDRTNQRCKTVWN